MDNLVLSIVHFGILYHNKAIHAITFFPAPKIFTKSSYCSSSLSSLRYAYLTKPAAMILNLNVLIVPEPNRQNRPPGLTGRAALIYSIRRIRSHPKAHKNYRVCCIFCIYKRLHFVRSLDFLGPICTCCYHLVAKDMQNIIFANSVPVHKFF